MARKTRFAPPDFAYHVVNRGNDRQTIFREACDYNGFLELLAEGVQRFGVRLYSYCLMPNHFHLVAQPEGDDELSAFMQWVTCRYACTFRQQTGTVGHGHVFQRRFWNAPLYDERAFMTVMRYVEGNPLRAMMVARAEDWEWSSMRDRETSRQILSPAPIALPPQWEAFVNTPLPCDTLSRIRRTTVPMRGRPMAGSGRSI